MGFTPEASRNVRNLLIRTMFWAMKKQGYEHVPVGLGFFREDPSVLKTYPAEKHTAVANMLQGFPNKLNGCVLLGWKGKQRRVKVKRGKDHGPSH